MMKKSINFKEVLVDFNGNSLIFEDQELTVGLAAKIALLNDASEGLTALEKDERYKTAEKIHSALKQDAGDPSVLTLTEVANLKQIVGNFWSTPVVGSFNKIIG